MMLGGSTKSVGWVRLVAGLVPVGIVGVVMLIGVGGSGPAYVSPDDDFAELIFVAAGNIRMTEMQHEALARAGEIAMAEQVETPFFYSNDGVVEEVVGPNTEEVPEPGPEFRVTSVMSGGKTLIAVVNGKPRQLGDSIGEGWTLAEILPEEDKVVLTHDDGRTIEVLLKHPRLGRQRP